MAQRGDGGVCVGHGHRVGRGAQGGGDCALVTGVDGEHGGDRAEQSGDRVGGGQQRAHAVLAVEAELEGVLAGQQRGAVAVGGRGLLAGLGEALGEVVEHGQRGLVLGVEALLARVEAGDPGLEGGEVVLGAVGPGDGRSPRRLEPAELLVGGRGPGLQGVHLAGQPGQALATVGRGPDQPGDPAVLLGCRLFGGTACGHRGLEGATLGVDLGRDRGLLLADAGGLGLELVGVTTEVERLLLGPGGVAHALGGERRRTAEPLTQAGQAEPGLLRAGQGRQVVPQGGLEAGLGLLGPGRGGLDLLAALDQDRLVGELLLERGPGGDQVVGDEAGPGVADLGLHDRGPARHLGLPPQWLELAADLAEQVGQPVEVALGRVELAERLLLALAVLEDAGGLLDEAAAVLRGGVQDRVELTLTDDHVHLAADAGVAEQLLDVEQAARVAVDGVVGAARAEHRAADRHLGVLDRQRAVGVVDGEQHLGPAQRRAAGRAGEDDVLHLAAAQALGALLTHHPGEGVDDVGLARAVGADDAGDARLQLERRRRGEGLEPLEGQALQVQRGSSRRRLGRVFWSGQGDPDRVGLQRVG